MTDELIEPDDISALRIAGHELIGAAYRLVRWSEDTAVRGDLMGYQEMLSHSDDADWLKAWCGRNGLHDDEGPMVALSTFTVTALGDLSKHINETIMAHTAFGELVTRLTNELTGLYEGLPTLCGVQARSHCHALESFGFNLVAESLRAIDAYLPAAERDPSIPEFEFRTFLCVRKGVVEEGWWKNCEPPQQWNVSHPFLAAGGSHVSRIVVSGTCSSVGVCDDAADLSDLYCYYIRLDSGVPPDHYRHDPGGRGRGLEASFGLSPGVLGSELVARSDGIGRV
jgi:hypothetical protein